MAMENILVILVVKLFKYYKENNLVEIWDYIS